MRLSGKSVLIFALAQLLFFSFPAFAAQSITVTSPNGGETWTIGSTVTISWTSSNVSYVYLDLTNAAGGYGYGDSITNLVNVVGNPGTTSWTIPTNVNAGTYKLKIGTCSAKANRNDCGGASIADVYDYSDGTITLAAAPTTTTTTAGCSADSDCAITGTTWAGATFCDSTGLKVEQYKVAPTCQSGTCIFTTSVQAVKEDCSSSNKICDFTTAGGGVYACIAGTPPSACAANAQITTRCICGSGVYGGAYYTWSGYDPGVCCGSGSSASQISPGPCPTTTTFSQTTTTAMSNATNATSNQTATTAPLTPAQTSPQRGDQGNATATTQYLTTTTNIFSNATISNTCPVPNGMGVYSNGLCVINFCNPRYYDCDGNSVNGCESSRPCGTPASPETPTAGKKQTQCSDNDGGISIYSHGFATDKDGKISEDACAENNLTEYYCKDGEVSMHETTCANGCNDGACVSPLAKLIQDLIALLKSIFNLK